MQIGIEENNWDVSSKGKSSIGNKTGFKQRKYIQVFTTQTTSASVHMFGDYVYNNDLQSDSRTDFSYTNIFFI